MNAQVTVHLEGFYAGRLQAITSHGHRQLRSSVTRGPRRHWFWRFMLVLGIALAIDFLLDDKLIFAGIALLWILACFFTLSRLRRSRHLP